LETIIDVTSGDHEDRTAGENSEKQSSFVNSASVKDTKADQTGSHVSININKLLLAIRFLIFVWCRWRSQSPALP